MDIRKEKVSLVHRWSWVNCGSFLYLLEFVLVVYCAFCTLIAYVSALGIALAFYHSFLLRAGWDGVFFNTRSGFSVELWVYEYCYRELEDKTRAI